jgi:beta-mannosidase
MIKMDLGGTWRMKSTKQTDWISAQVPGSVASDLMRAGFMEDPYYRDEQYSVYDSFLRDYEYEREFTADDSLLRADRLELICEGIDTISEIRLNGETIANTWNMHRTYHFDIKGKVNAGHNKLHIVFKSPINYVQEKQKERYLWAANGDYVVQGYPHLRKAHHMFGWDWGPKLPDSGIWRDIYLKAYSDGRLQDIQITQDHTESGCVLLHTQISPERFGEAKLELEAVLISPQGTMIETQTCATSGGSKQIQLQVEAPELWWPNGLGAQPLYELQLRLKTEGKILEERSYKLGLRTLTVKQEPDQWGETFEFVINGYSIFTMGANYIPEDNLRDRHSRERTKQLIRDCVDANFNCIRVWGGGFYPDDYFYDLCDEYGLIVWQDHLFACAEYEMTQQFTEEIKCEITDNVKRLRHHASLGIWCGNNEMELAWIEWDFPKRSKLKTDYVKQFEIVIPELTKELDPCTFYWKASPSSGGGFDEPNAPHKGDVHYWDVWHGGKPFTEYRNHYFRFCSEFGYQSFPLMKTVEQFTEQGDRNIFSSVMESHQKNPAGNSKILSGIAENFLYPNNFDSLLYVSQLLQAEAMRYGVEHWRRNRGHCMGSIYWQLNDCWPVASWSSIDYFGRWKALHYSAKRFYAPILLSAEEEGSQVKLTVTNDSLQPVDGTITWRLRDSFSAIVQSSSIDVSVDPLSAKLCADLDFADVLINDKVSRTLYLEQELKVNGITVSGGIVLFVKPKHFQFEQQLEMHAEITEEADNFIIHIHSDAFAAFVELDFALRDARFSDNFFHVSAGDPKRIVLRKEDVSKPSTLEEIRQELKIRSIIDSYDLT